MLIPLFKLHPGAIFPIRYRSLAWSRLSIACTVAIRENERISIHGDYDCDGVLGTHILRSVLGSLGASQEPTSLTAMRVTD